MKIYLVGGAVRDKLLGLPVKERDYVVVGATVADMQRLGYKQVGKEFPVFLHPKSNEEYALARMERKIKPGYKGFTFDTAPTVNLEDDLIRRDLTINAMAEDSETGQLFDPYHGKADLENKILRHVSPAFAEDPVRILRVGRFLARFAHRGFYVAPETIALMQTMVAKGEVDALVAERVWKELERALTENNPEKFFDVLEQAHALKKLFPHLSLQSDGMKALIASVSISPHSLIRFGALLHDQDTATINELCKRYRAPNAFKELALLTARNYATALNVDQLSAQELMSLFSILDIFRRETRFHDFVLVCHAIALATHKPFDKQKIVGPAQAAKSFDVQELLAQGLENQAFAEKLREKRIEKIEQWMSEQRKAK